jgi:Zn-dependent peptidase ImmA (M78 family)
VPGSTIDVHADVLSWARERSGYDLETASSKLKLDAEDLIALETGQTSPSPAKIREMAHLYRISPAVFFLDEIPTTGFAPPKDFRSLPGNEQGSFSPALRREIDRVRAQVAFMNDLANDRVVSSTYQPPVASPNQPAESFGPQIRDWLAIDSIQELEGIRDSRLVLNAWIAAIEDRGVLVSQVSGIPVGEMRGFCLADARFPMIVLNGADGYSARLFTLVHELAHILSGEECVCSGPLTNGKVETYCNAVAAAAIIPRDRLLQQPLVQAANGATAWSLQQLAMLAAPFGASREAMLRRLLTLGLTTDRHYQAVRQQLTSSYADSNKKQTGGPERKAILLRNLGRTYISSVLQARNRGMVTDLEAADRLFAKVRWVDELAAELGLERT